MAVLNFQVDKTKCIKCEECVKDCSNFTLEMGEDGFPKSIKNDCFNCQHCLAICPTGAISSCNKKPEDSFTVKNLPTPQEVEALIKMRKSCRRFKNENVELEKIEKLVDIINWAPTGCNYRGLHLSVVSKKEKMDEIRNDLYSCLKKMLEKNPNDPLLNSRKGAILSGSDFVFRNAPHMIAVSVDKNSPCKDADPFIALSYMELYAKSLGLGTLWCGLGFWTVPNCKEIIEKLQIPNGFELGYIMLFGNPTPDYKRAIQPVKYKVTMI